MTTGIYLLRFPCGNTYIGQSINIGRRFAMHKKAILSGTSHGKLKTMTSLPILEILEECKVKFLDERERYYIKVLNPSLNCNAGGQYGSPSRKPTAIDIRYLIEKNRKNPVLHEHVECPWL